jgi:co-chaperonin GroES (HSP10)
MAIKAFGKSIIFQFEENTRNGHFEQAQASGIYVPPSHEDSASDKARWGTVVAVGEDVVDDIQIGGRILIEALRWTESFTVEGQSYWKTDHESVLAVPA